MSAVIRRRQLSLRAVTAGLRGRSAGCRCAECPHLRERSVASATNPKARAIALARLLSLPRQLGLAVSVVNTPSI
eukprot:362795-Chlamydomonas_euryale.AAC.2